MILANKTNHQSYVACQWIAVRKHWSDQWAGHFAHLNGHRVIALEDDMIDAILRTLQLFSLLFWRQRIVFKQVYLESILLSLEFYCPALRFISAERLEVHQSTIYFFLAWHLEVLAVWSQIWCIGHEQWFLLNDFSASRG